MNQKLKDIVESLTGSERDALYRFLWADYMREDVIGYCEENNISYDDNLVEAIVNLYVYHGEYSCELSYWDNIDALIGKCKDGDSASMQ